MKSKYLIFNSIATIAFVAMLFACEDSLNEMNKYNQEVDVPQGVAKKINLFYTDSGTVKSNLKSPKMYDYSQEKFAYRVFPNGVKVDFFNSDSTKSTIVADSAIVYINTDLIDLRNNVEITRSDSVILTTSQLYWDTDKEWVFTDREYTIQQANGSKNNGFGFDASQDFKVYNSRMNKGVQVIKNDSL